MCSSNGANAVSSELSQVLTTREYDLQIAQMDLLWQHGARTTAVRPTRKRKHPGNTGTSS